MHWPSPFYVEAKFGPSVKRINEDWQRLKWNFTEQWDRHWPQKGGRNFGRAESETNWENLKRYTRNWLQHVTRRNNKRMSKMTRIVDRMKEDYSTRPKQVYWVIIRYGWWWWWWYVYVCNQHLGLQISFWRRNMEPNIKYYYSRTSNNGHRRGIQILSVIGGVR
jgi:hypothetical protein